MALPGSQETMPPNSDLSPAEIEKIKELNTELSDNKWYLSKLARQKSLLVQHAAKVETAAAMLRRGESIQQFRKQLHPVAGPKSLTWWVEAETARLQVELEKVRKEVKTAQVWAVSRWAEEERVFGEVGRLTKAALTGVREVARLRGERERVRRLGGKTMAGTEKAGEEEEESSDYARVKQELSDTLLELDRMNHESVSMRFDLSKPMPETDRLGIEAERLRTEVNQVAWMTVPDCEKAAKD